MYRFEREKVKKAIMERVVYVAWQIVSEARSHEISIRLRTLIKYAYIAYILGEDRFSYIRGMSSKVRAPRFLFHKAIYRAVEEELRKRFEVRFETRRGNKRYAVITVKQPALAKVIR